MTERQEQVIGLLASEPVVSARHVAGKFGMRPQDAGRVLNTLERKGLVEFATGPPAGYRLTSLGWTDELEINFVRDLMSSEVEALIEHADRQVWIYTKMAKAKRDDPDEVRELEMLSEWYMRRRRIFYELKAELEDEVAEWEDG